MSGTCQPGQLARRVRRKRVSAPAGFFCRLMLTVVASWHRTAVGVPELCVVEWRTVRLPGLLCAAREILEKKQAPWRSRSLAHVHERARDQALSTRQLAL